MINGMGNAVSSRIINDPTPWRIGIETSEDDEVFNFSFTGVSWLNIDWGDGSAIDTFSADFTDAHTYATTGSYTIKMWGRFNGVAGSGMQLMGNPCIKQLHGKIVGITGIRSVDSMFAQCTGLTELPSGLFDNISFPADYYVTYTFWDCSSLITVPSDLFSKHLRSIVSYFGTFMGCSSLTSFPTDMFSNKTAIIALNECFSGCIALTGDVPLLWDTAQYPNINDYPDCFLGCTGVNQYYSETVANEIPVDWGGFDPGTSTWKFLVVNPNPDSVYTLNLNSPTSVTVDWGDGSHDHYTTSGDKTHTYATAGKYVMTVSGSMATSGVIVFNNSAGNAGGRSYLKRVYNRMNHISGTKTAIYMFRNCYGLVTLPDSLFSTLSTGATDFTSTFQGCSSLTAIPSDIFDSQKSSATTFTNTFKGCTALDGNAPELWDSGVWTAVVSNADCFDGCTGLDNYADIPSAWGGGGA